MPASPSGSVSKSACPPVFALGPDPAAPPAVTNAGKYYKNVRSEWASLVATPPTARFQVRNAPPLVVLVLVRVLVVLVLVVLVLVVLVLVVLVLVVVVVVVLVLVLLEIGGE